MSTAQPGGGGRHDEPNEYGFAGETTAPEPERPHRPDEIDEAEEAEEVAVPADDLTEGLSESLDDDRVPERDHHQNPGADRR
jgi:hypothetical protein